MKKSFYYKNASDENMVLMITAVDLDEAEQKRCGYDLFGFKLDQTMTQLINETYLKNDLSNVNVNELVNTYMEATKW